MKVWKVTDVLPNGEIEFMNVVERVHMVNQLPDHDPIEYDSARDKTPPPGFEDAAQADRRAAERDPHHAARQDRCAANRKSAARSAEEDAPIALRLPDKPVAIGETWDEPFDVKS